MSEISRRDAFDGTVVGSEPREAAEEPPAASGPPPNRRRTTAYWIRWVHVYTSMASLLIVLFFGLTGITLNHPTWAFGGSTSSQTVSGILPAGYQTDGSVDFFAISEFLRAEHNVKGAVSDFRSDTVEGTMSFDGPGYAADLVFAIDTGTFDLVVRRDGLVAVLNDLHKGRNTTTSWSWVIDIAAGLLVVVAVTGLGVQLMMRKRRTRALTLSALAALVTLTLIWVTIN